MVFDIVKSPKQSKFFQIREGLYNDDFYFLKFYIFYNFLPKEQLEGYLIITALYLKKKNKKI